MEKVMKRLCYYEPAINNSYGRNFLTRGEMREMAVNMIKNTPSIDKRTRLTKADAIAWWEYIRLCLPLNYERAIIHREIKKDVNIGDLEGIKRLNINDYFRLYSLPRVTAENGIVSVDGEPRIRYANRMEYFRNRDIFTVAHNDKRFIYWKNEQVKHCQNGRCAWCSKPIKVLGSHVDHILPLIFFGKNEPWNFVVACEKCNKAKSSDTNGWNDLNNMYLKNKKPSWIKKNKYDALLKKILVEAENKYEMDEESYSVIYAHQSILA